jgi:enamine deaminase RidA (YjgF/YER057c/UK114 family)
MKTSITRYETGTVWEDKMAYSRAVAAGPMIWVSGCIGVLSDGNLADGLQAQTTRCLERILDALSSFQAELCDIVKIRIYTTQLDRWEEIASVMEPMFRTHRPANLLVGVAELADGALIEVEAEAFRHQA